MIKKSVATWAFLGLMFFAVSPNATADTEIGTKHMTGVGLGGGYLTYGLSLKHHLSEDGAIIGNLGANYGFSVDLGYVMKVTTLWDGKKEGQLDLNVGGAGMVWMFKGGSTYYGARAVIEFSYKMAKMPLEISAEWGPAFLTGNFLYGGIQGGAGGGSIRWYF